MHSSQLYDGIPLTLAGPKAANMFVETLSLMGVIEGRPVDVVSHLGINKNSICRLQILLDKLSDIELH